MQPCELFAALITPTNNQAEKQLMNVTSSFTSIYPFEPEEIPENTFASSMLAFEKQSNEHCSSSQDISEVFHGITDQSVVSDYESYDITVAKKQQSFKEN